MKGRADEAVRAMVDVKDERAATTVMVAGSAVGAAAREIKPPRA
jgi:hypothetical protein